MAIIFFFHEFHVLTSYLWKYVLQLYLETIVSHTRISLVEPDEVYFQIGEKEMKKKTGSFI